MSTSPSSASRKSASRTASVIGKLMLMLLGGMGWVNQRAYSRSISPDFMSWVTVWSTSAAAGCARKVSKLSRKLAAPTEVAQAPKLAPHIPAMVARIAQSLGLDASRVNVKAKTAERLGAIGRGEGIAAEAVVLIETITGA